MFPQPGSGLFIAAHLAEEQLPLAEQVGGQVIGVAFESVVQGPSYPLAIEVLGPKVVH